MRLEIQGLQFMLKKFLFTVLLFSAFSRPEASELVLYGPLSQGALVIGEVIDKGSADASVFLNGERIRVSSEGNFVIGFGRDAAIEQHLELNVAGKTVETRLLNLSQRQYETQRVEGVPQETVTPKPEKLARIRAEAALVSAARRKMLALNFFQQPFVAPMERPVTGVYGSQRVYNGTPKRPHYGVDYAAPIGAVVHAPASGIVTLRHDDMYYSGGTLIIDHGYGVSSTFIHLSEILVNEGDSIRQGDAIAKVGQGGRATGPHLDWRMNWFKVRIDPQLVLKIDLPER